MKKLLTLPENLTSVFYDLESKSREEWFVASDPSGKKVGSGGGTAHLLARCWEQNGREESFESYLSSEKRLLIHAGGQSRRLPGYAPSGKVLTPVPVFRWARGQRLDQNLLDLQVPLYEKLLKSTSGNVNTLIASGDVLIQAPKVPASLPNVDVVCFGLWVEPQLASRHGVFFTPRQNPQELSFMLQKPSHREIEKLAATHLFMMDIGIWLLSDRAVERLMKKCGWQGEAFENRDPEFYDLYSQFGTALGSQPTDRDPELEDLTIAVLPLEGGSFFHYGTSKELITSTQRVQNQVKDQRAIWHHRIKPHPSLFVQNAETSISWESVNNHIWIENSYIPQTWHLSDHHVLTGIPKNNWSLQLSSGMCLDFIPIGDKEFCIRPYGINDAFRGEVGNPETIWMGEPVLEWFNRREITLEEAGKNFVREDLQNAALFPVLREEEITEAFVLWMIDGKIQDLSSRRKWLQSRRLNADQISAQANLARLYQQRDEFRKANLAALAQNYKHSVFYQVDLKSVASDYSKWCLPLPDALPYDEFPFLKFKDHMFRSQVLKESGESDQNEEKEAFRVLRNSIVDSLKNKRVLPQWNGYSDQIVWGRSPARLDLAGGWSDTPPFCMMNGGSVVNCAVNLNGQPPLQVFIRPSQEKKIVLRSIDIGVVEEIFSYEDLKDYSKVGSAFSIPRAALCLAGFHPDFCEISFSSLKAQLEAFGCGLEISLLAAIPKGSGLGTSSILAATILGTLSDFCDLNWDKQEVGCRTLILEQLLTTGGGWQDQFGGLFPGVKMLETVSGMQDSINVRWLPDLIFNHPETKGNWLLYYTGITRVAKNILSEIVRGMFLNEGKRLRILEEIQSHAVDTFDAIQRCDYELTARMIGRSWDLNKALDSGTNPDAVDVILNRIKDYALGYKLLGAGGGGYLLICAKDTEAAGRIQSVLSQNPPNPQARFVKMDLSGEGFQVSRS